MSNEIDPIAINPALSFGLNFDSRDLTANQRGEITSRQVHLLRQKRRRLSPPVSWLERGFLYLVYGITPYKHQWNLVGADITATISQQQDGQVRLPKSVEENAKSLPNSSYRINIKRKQVHVDRRALRSFKDREAYTVYYAPKSKYALSAELHTTVN